MRQDFYKALGRNFQESRVRKNLTHGLKRQGMETEDDKSHGAIP
jgi:hypothetical protein